MDGVGGWVWGVRLDMRWGFWDFRVVLWVGSRWWRVGRRGRVGVVGDGATIDEVIPEVRVVGVMCPGIKVTVAYPLSLTLNSSNLSHTGKL